MRLDQLPKSGHETPYQKWEDNSPGCINGPSLKIYPHPELSSDRPSFEEQCRSLAPEACLWAESETENLSSEESSDEESSGGEEWETPPPLASDSSESESEEDGELA